MQATRTLGSLFLHQQDAAAHNNSTVNTSIGEKMEGIPFHESALSSYLLNLKREEEVNREKSHDGNERKMEDEKEENDGEMKINAGFVIDPVNTYLYV